MNLLYRVFEETYRIVLDSGVFILLGFFLAGVLHEFVDPARIGRMLGGRSLKSILMAALVGAPLHSARAESSRWPWRSGRRGRAGRRPSPS